MGVGENTNDCKISRLCVAIVNLRNRMGKEKRRQTFCDKRDHNFSLSCCVHSLISSLAFNLSPLEMVSFLTLRRSFQQYQLIFA